MDKTKIIDGLMFPQIKRSAAEVQERVTRETIPEAARVIKDTWEKEAKKFDDLAFPEAKRSAAETMETQKRKTIPDVIASLKDTVTNKETLIQGWRKDYDSKMKLLSMLKNMAIRK